MPTGPDPSRSEPSGICHAPTVIDIAVGMNCSDKALYDSASRARCAYALSEVYVPLASANFGCAWCVRVRTPDRNDSRVAVAGAEQTGGAVSQVNTPSNTPVKTPRNTPSLHERERCPLHEEPVCASCALLRIRSGARTRTRARTESRRRGSSPGSLPGRRTKSRGGWGSAASRLRTARALHE